MDLSESIAHRASGYCQAAALGGGARFLRQLGPVKASNLGGWLARTAGPSLSVSGIANANLQHAFPEYDAGQRDRIIRSVWDNLGRTVAELPHLSALRRTSAGAGWELQGEEHVDAMRGSNRQALFFSGHFGNWEMVLPIAARLGLPVSGFYRATSNVRVNTVIQRMRLDALGPASSMFAKGSAGARAALLHLQGGGSLGMLTDQKMNDGIAVPFMGRRAMTAPALAQLALRFDAPVIPVHVVRLRPGAAADGVRGPPRDQPVGRPQGRCVCADPRDEPDARALDPGRPGVVAMAAPPLAEAASVGWAFKPTILPADSNAP
jgi:KDO2-lipid IV(A) lauroyltransferase